MARVEIPAPGDLIMDAAGNVRVSVAVSLKLAGTVTDATHYSALTGGTSTTGGLVSGSDGTVVDGSGNRRYVDSGVPMDMTISGRTKQLEPLSARDVRVIKEAAINPEHPEYGAAGDGTTLDTAAFNLVAAAIGSYGAEVVLPHTYSVENFALTSKSGVTFKGPGGFKRKAGDGDSRICTLTNCSDIRFEGVETDHNNVEKYGGYYFDNCSGVWFEGCHFLDSNLRANWATFDHYGIVFQNGCTDVHVSGNKFEDIEAVEFDNCQHVYIERNTIHRAAGTAPLGSFFVANGYVLKNIKILDNIIVDPRKQGITIQHEAAGMDNVVVRDVEIRRNTIVHLTDATVTNARLIQFGNFIGAASTGNSYTGVIIEDNFLYVDPSVTLKTVPHIAFSQQAGNTFNRCSIQNNLVNAKTSDWAIDARRLTESRIDGNEVWDATNGISNNTGTGNVMRGNRVEAATTAYNHSTSGGANIISDNEVVGTPTARWSATVGATDFFRDRLPDVTATWDPASIADQSQAVVDTTVTGAAVGDYTEVTLGSDLLNCELSSYVRTANSVRAVLNNQSGAPRDIASGTLRICVTKRS